MIDLPLQSSLKPSELEFAGAMDSMKTVKPQTFPGNHESRTEREVNSFELNNFENINRFRKHSFNPVHPEIKNRSHSLQNFSRGSISQKTNGMVFEKRLSKHTYQVDHQVECYAFIYTYIHTYIHTYTHTHTHIHQL